MGGKAKKDNSMMQFQMQQAQEARQKEAERKYRLESGTETVNSLFGGFKPEFYDKYKNASLDYQLPQLDTQYNKAKEKLTYDLARAGTLRSTAAADAAAALASERDINEAGLRAQADQGAGALRENILAQQNQAIAQLYATEDPNVAANTATSMVNQANLAQPNLTPLGALFTPIAVGGIGALAGMQGQADYNKGIGMNPKSPLSQGSGKTTA
jgi:hypothetical protein